MPQETLIYLAGFFDGEGCLYLNYKRGHGLDSRIVITQFFPRGLELLEELQQAIGSGVICNKCKDGWDLTISTKAVIVPLLEQMLPYLRIKRLETIKYLYSLNRWLTAQIPPDKDWRKTIYS